jgi:hypothetical protein
LYILKLCLHRWSIYLKNRATKQFANRLHPAILLTDDWILNTCDPLKVAIPT